MAYTVLLRFSPARAAVHILTDDEALEGGEGVRLRLICQTDEEAERAPALVC